MPSQTLQLLRTAVRAQGGDSADRWLTGTIATFSASDTGGFITAYASAARHVGRGALAIPAALAADLAAGPANLNVGGWTVFDAARVVLLLSLAESVSEDVFAAAATECYEQGDAREQQSWLKALPALPGPEQFLASAIDACRTNIVPLFEAIACENVYPSRYFPDRNFNQLVLKALFVGVALERIVDLRSRLNSELDRMARDFAAERKAAGRPVPPDLPLALMTETPA